MTTTQQTSANPFNAIADQEIKSIAQLICVYTLGAIEDYEVKDRTTGELKTGKSGFVQILQRRRPESDRLELKTIKVKEDDYPLIDLLNKQYQNKPVTLQVEISENYGKMVMFLTAEQPKIKFKSASDSAKTAA